MTHDEALLQAIQGLAREVQMHVGPSSTGDLNAAWERAETIRNICLNRLADGEPEWSDLVGKPDAGAPKKLRPPVPGSAISAEVRPSLMGALFLSLSCQCDPAGSSLDAAGGCSVCRKRRRTNTERPS